MPHRHTMSLAHPSSHTFLDSNGTTYNPFEFSIEREVDPIPHSGHDTLRENIHAPQGCVPHVLNLLAPNVTSPPMSRPDFIRGFGLDIPEEEEGAANIAEEANEEKLDDDGDQQANQYSPAQLESYSPKTERNVDEADTALQSRFHSRHASKLSTALSTQSADALGADHFLEEKDIEMKHENSDDQENNLDEDIVNEWTGSEDVYTGEMSDGEEVCLWSPSLIPSSSCVFSRVSENGQTPQMKKGHGKSALSDATVAVLRHKLMYQGAFLTFPALQTIPSLYPRATRTSSQTPVKKRQGLIWLKVNTSGGLITILVLSISAVLHSHFLIRAVHLHNIQHMIPLMHTLVHPPTKMLFRVHMFRRSLLSRLTHLHLATTPSTRSPRPSCSVLEVIQVHGARVRTLTLHYPTHLHSLICASLLLASLSMSQLLSSSRVDSPSDLLQAFPPCHRHNWRFHNPTF